MNEWALTCADMHAAGSALAAIVVGTSEGAETSMAEANGVAALNGAAGPHDAVDVLIIGGGPTGLFAAFYAGLRGSTSSIVDSLEQPGGAVAAMYPEKYIYDVGGFPRILARWPTITLAAEPRFRMLFLALFAVFMLFGTSITIIGATLPFEYPWLDECVFPVDAMRITPRELKPQLHAALEAYPRLRANCLAAREKLLALYDAEHLLQLLQDQIDGKPMPKGYLKG